MQNGMSYTDEALALRFQAGDTQAAEELTERCKQTVRARARALYLAGGDREDLLQEGMIGLFKAIRTYREDDQSAASFRTYAIRCIDHQMYEAIRSASRKKNGPLNSFVPIEEMEAQIGTAQSPEAILLGEEDARRRREQIHEALSAYERQVLERYLAGMDYREIAQELGKADKSVDNALQRIRQKVAGIVRRER